MTTYRRKTLGPFYVMWEKGERHVFLTFGFRYLEIQVNKWPKEGE